MSTQKLFFEFDNETPTAVSLAEIVAGRAGKVTLGKKGVYLWTPNSGLPKGEVRDVVCDLRFGPLSRACYDKFVEETRGLYLPAHFVIFSGEDCTKIRTAREYFDYVITPSQKIKNTPADFRAGVLAYTRPPRVTRTAPQVSY